MKKTLFFLLLINIISFSQSSIQKIEISSDGKETNYSNKLNFNEKSYNLGDVPFGTTPDWQVNLYRQAGGVAWGDYDGDGDLDLAVGNYFSNSYPPVDSFETQIYRNDNGVLTTYPAWKSTDMRSSTDVKFADINGDGRVDLLACNGDASFASSVIYMNSASGLSTSPSWISTQFAWSVGAAFGDVDGDGDLDIAFGTQGISPNPYKPIAVFHNTNGQYPTSPSWISSDQMITNSVAWGDINNSDLGSTVFEKISDNNGYVFHLPYMPVTKVDSILVNNIKISGYNFDRVSGWVSLGRRVQVGTSVKIYYQYFVKGDLAASKWVNFSSGIYFNDNGVLQQTPTWTTGNTQTKKGSAWGDYDNDGYMDLVLGGNGNQTVIYKNTNGTIGTNPIWSSNSTNTGSQEVAWGDVNNDGWIDLAVAHFSPPRVEVFLNRAGTLDNSATWSFVTPNGCNCLAFGDVNGDGFIDLAIGTAAQPAMVFVNKSVKSICKDININPGWNLIALPIVPPSSNVPTLFPTATSQAYSYNNGYVPNDSLKIGVGYWLKFNSHQIVNICGAATTQTTIPLIQGWNLIGIYDKNIPVSSLASTPPGIINSQFYGYDNQYVPSDTLKSGLGYWVKSTQNGVINLPLLK